LECFVACDLETTGTDPQRDEIIEVCLLKVRRGEVIDRLVTLVRPSAPLPPSIERLTGISEAHLSRAPGWAEVRPRVRTFLGGLPLLGHNVSFDASFLKRWGADTFGPLLDTAALARIVLPTAPSYRLETLCRMLHIPREASHRAAPDAAAAVHLFGVLRESLASLAPDVVRDIAGLLSRGGSPWAEVFTVACEKPPAVSRPAARAEGEASGDTADAPADPPTWSEAAVAALFGEGGALAESLPHYEYRPQQLAVARAVARALETGRHLLVEAGTGTGKSLAYLVPAALWALTTGERVLISTHTVNLQDQLLQKDIPLAQRVLGRSLRVALLKGRQHYLCLRRWGAVLGRPRLSPAEAHFYARLTAWRGLTRSGDGGEMNFTPEERTLWQEVRADPEGCDATRCEHAGSCYLVRARKAAERAHLVITNHALLLSDLKEGGLLPPYGPLVLDEAHHLEEVATNLFGCDISYGEVAGWLAAVENAVQKPPEGEAGARLAAARSEAAAFFTAVGKAARAAASQETAEVRLAPGAANLDADGCIRAAFAGLTGSVNAVLTVLERRLGRLSGAEGGHAAGNVARLIETGQDLLHRLHLIYTGKDPHLVTWVETGQQEPPRACTLKAAPVEVGDILYRRLFARRGPVILTSATLTSEGSFAFFKERCGLDRLPPAELDEVMVESPFPFREQALLCVVNDLPEPPAGEGEPYLDAVSACICHLAEAVPGKMLALFTAHRSLQKVYVRLRDALADRGIAVLGHGVDGGRSRLLEEFTGLERAVLLGAASFWEGVDLPGQALQCVVVVRLPFTPPGKPLAEARQEVLRQRGCDHFSRMAVPQAVIRFKQGFGRLIRTRQDRGVVVILDTRLLTRSYGKKFLASLPPLAVYAAPVQKVAAAAAAWLRSDTFCGRAQ
ncbi:MAG TPA: DNA polymerase III subunit epsilon, partial [Peptococcaceae bacterium]|nr:DNA polymerase III subunit epsilon [Peptococcaceae bacterium]